MEEEIARLRQALVEEKRLREEEQRRREEAQDAARASQPQTLETYLEACHSLSLAIHVLTERSLTTQGDTTNPVGRIYPRRIVPWHDFPAAQEKIWNLLSEPSFTARRQFPSQHQMDYVRSLNGPISSEHGLRYFERDTVESAVQRLVDAVYRNPSLRARLGLQGTVTFESHTNLGSDDSLLGTPENTLGDQGAGDPPAAVPAAIVRARRIARGKGNLADQFCVYRRAEGSDIPATAIEYKAPHKLSIEEVTTGLVSEIQPDRDVINKDGEGFAFASRHLAAAVVTQLFSYMVGKGLRYGYVCTGQAFVFLHIPGDPSAVFYHVCVPNQDVIDDDENRLHRTAVAQVFAFTLQALQVVPPPSSWYDAAANLDLWEVEYDDVLRRIPISVRKERKVHASPYKPQRWRGFKRSPIRTRSRCQQPGSRPRPEDDDSGGEADPPSPTVGRSTRSGNVGNPAGSGRTRGQRGQRGQRETGGRQQGGTGQRRIQDRPYCTHRCLLGLACGGPVDAACPNAESHGPRHLGRAEFLRLLRAQLAEDRGPDADATPLYVSGAVGALFKLRLSACGYTLVAKGVQWRGLRRLQHENQVYEQLRPVQGQHVPVCLGLVDLLLPLYYNGGVYEHVMLLSWAGQPLPRCTGKVDKTRIVDAVTAAYASIHRLQVLHNDAEARNVTYDGGPMVVDFERAKLCARPPLGSISPNSPTRKRKHSMPSKQADDPFARELRSIVDSVSRCLGIETEAMAAYKARTKGAWSAAGVLP